MKPITCKRFYIYIIKSLSLGFSSESCVKAGFRFYVDCVDRDEGRSSRGLGSLLDLIFFGGSPTCGFKRELMYLTTGVGLTCV